MPYIRLQVKGTANLIASYKGSNGQIVFCDDASAAKWPGKGQRLFVMNGTTSGGRAVLMSHDLPWATDDIANTAITTAKLADNAITSEKIKDGEVKTVDLADDAVTTPKIKDSNVTEPKLASNAVTTDKIANKNVTGPKLADSLLGDGLVRDGSSIKVDFSDLPTDKFEALLKGLKMLIPLSGNKSFYVATDLSRKPNAGDTLIDNRGTQDYPFRTIQACVNYVTNTYSVGKHHITIYIDNGTYNESLTLPDYARSSGYIELRPWNVTTNNANDWPVTISATQTTYTIENTVYTSYTNWAVNANSGGTWRLAYLKIQRIEHAAEQTGGVAGCVQSSGNSTVSLYGCWINQQLPTGTTDLYKESNNAITEDITVRLLSGDAYGRVYIYHGDRPHKLTFQKGATTNKPRVYVLVAQRAGSVWLSRNFDDRNDTTKYVDCSGTCDVFAYGDQSGAYNTVGSGTLLEFRVPDGSSVTGKRFQLTGGSCVNPVGESTPNPVIPGDTSHLVYFPGSINGTLDDLTYCWYGKYTPSWATATALATCSSNCASALAAHAALPASQAHGSGGDDNTGGEQSTSDAEGGN